MSHTKSLVGNISPPQAAVAQAAPDNSSNSFIGPNTHEAEATETGITSRRAITV